MTTVKETDKNERSLSWTDSSGNTYRFYSKPLLKVCSFILLQEMCERMAFYGLMPTLKGFLRDSYGFDDTARNSFVSLFSGLTYVFSILSAILADTVLGIYNTILVFSGMYMLGLILLVISAIPDVNQVWMVYLALYGLLGVGAGGIKSCVSVLGGQQYSPVDQKEQLTTFFTLFYAAINVGALIGGFVVPIVIKEANYFVAYLIPAIAFAAATVVLVLGSKRYVLMKPQGSVVLKIVKVIYHGAGKLSLNKCRESQGGTFEDHFIDDAQSLFSLVPFFALVIPFNICYIQIFTGFESQSAKMYSSLFGWEMPYAWMVNIDPISVILGSLFVDKVLFPALRNKNLMPSILNRFVIGFCCGVISNLCAMGVEFLVLGGGEGEVSIWWQVPQFAFIAFGEIFIISTSYEVAYTKSPDSLKAVASAFNLVGFAVAGFIAAALIQVCKPWFDSNHYDYYYGLFAGMCAAFAVVCYFLNGYFKRVFDKAEEHREAALQRSAAPVPKSEEATADPITVKITEVA